MNLTRRDFLGAMAAGAATAAVPGPIRRLLSPAAAVAAPTTLPAAAAGPIYAQRSRLAVTFNPIVLKGPTASERHLARMLDVGLARFFGAGDGREAWRKLIGPTEKVLIKFNRSAADVIATTDSLLPVLLASLSAGGVGPDRIMLLDVTAEQQRRSGACAPLLGYNAKPVRVLDRTEHLSAALDWADCLINVPFIKDHALAGVTCGMKNLSHGLIRSPANWHEQRCQRAIAHLFDLPAIRGKLRLNICNALRIVFDGGPGAGPDTMIDYSRLIFATDTVALDAHAARVLDRVRGARGLADLAEQGRPANYLTMARELQLGQCDLDRVDVIEAEA